mmetsp:Transcript_31757/g.38362  ORF Transcript_31757/g.38362 Transcript_31757/m.38362 type:complete len:225 (+) Transcript_31757:93-767(+)|eukprot:CAMPEP_0197854378 /NCGR_PEP_ID=MMETSP1438-20131217/24568_1 /TAXON_ID=1461541 /ORGANISM="Pterosperma sp., Strain CCMP1384" /LENGTH=224 /DNA_ID=CAMNT_0043469089 /DNA_START=86 /DNA_END=760 /DNA_ORIENTATION=-
MRAASVVFASLLLVTLVAAGSSPEGKQYLDKNKDKPGVVVLPSGLQYKVLAKGSGTEHPTASTSCTCHYHGTLVDGSVFDSSVERDSPIDFAPNQVIKGWTEAMQMMVEGDKWELYIPSDLAYGDNGSPPKIPGGATLIFTIEILKINGQTVPAYKCHPGSLELCNEKESKYITKQEILSLEDLNREHERLQKMDTSSMKPDLKEWVIRRMHILAHMAAAKDEL